VSSNLDGYSSVRAGASAGWASARSLRPITSSGALGGSPYGTVSTHFGQVSLNNCPKCSSLNPQQNHSLGLEGTLNGLQSNRVSGYVSGLNDSHGVTPTKSTMDFVSSYTPITLYQPRPSTAPVAESQDISLMLPPKRELPFSTSSSAKKPKKRPAKSEHSSTTGALDKFGSTSSLPNLNDLQTSISEAVSNMESASQISGNSAASVAATTKKRAAASRTTKPRAPKKQPAKAPSKIVSKVVKEDDVVPSVEQLLEETQKPPGQQQEASAAIDTQALLSRAEATRPYQSIEMPILSEKIASQSEISTASSQTRKCLVCTLRKGKVNLACIYIYCPINII
jgi:hypothetical protein